MFVVDDGQGDCATCEFLLGRWLSQPNNKPSV